MSGVDRRGPVDLRLVRLVPALRLHLVVTAVVAAATAVAVVIQAEALARGLTDLVDGGEITDGLRTLVVVLASVAVARGLSAATTEWSAARTMRALRHDVRVAVLDHATFDANRSTAGLASREATIITAGVDQLEPYVRQFLPSLTLAVAVPLVAGARILFADVLSAALIALTVPLIPIFMVLIGRMTERRTARQWAVLQQLGGHFLDVIEGMPTLRLFGRARAQRDSVRDVSEQYRATTMGALRIAFLSALALELIATLSVALIAVEIGLRLAGGSLDLGTALVVLLLTPECYLPLRRVGASFHAAQSGLDASVDLHDLLSRPTLPVGTATAPAAGALVVSNVALRRGGRVILEGLDLEVAPASITAVYGPSGAGKSTLIDACRGRLYERSGSITVGGIDVNELDPTAWADQLTTIGQRIAPSATPVLDDVRADTGASDTSVLEALSDVGLGDLATRRTDELSGGQLRRVHVARALVAVRSGHASYVLADEPTAHLDATSADAVWTALEGLARTYGVAVLVATHDDRCRSFADRIIDLATSVEAPADREVPAAITRRTDVTVTLRGDRPTPALANPERRRTSPSAPRDLRSDLRRVLALARPVRRRLTGATALGTMAEICTIGLAGAAAWLIIKASEQPELAALSIAILAVRAFGTGKGVFRYAERLATHDAGLRSLTEIRVAVVTRLAEIAPAGIPGWQRGDLLQRMVADVDRLLDLFVRVLGPVVAVAATAVGALVITMVLDVPAGVVLLVALTIVGMVVPAFTVRGELVLGPALADTRARLSGQALGITERLDELWANRTLGPARSAIDRVGREIDELEARRARLRAATSAIVAAAPLLTTTAILATIATAGTPPPGPVIGVLVLWPLAILELVGTVNEASASVPSLGASARRVLAVLDTPDPASASSAEVGVEHRPTISLDSVSARWPHAEVDALDATSLRLTPGSHASVVGPSGSGKSTLAAVLVGFLRPRSGSYRVDGTDVGDVIGDDLRRRVTWIQQVPWIADSTVRENLRLADPSASDDELREVLRSVRLDDWFGHLPAGLDSQLGRGGSAMSGGEAQRLALARVLLADHDIVVLDEPTANLDAVTAARVLDTVLDHCDDRTTVLIGHAG